MISFEEARAAALRYGEQNHAVCFEDGRVIERQHQWFFPVGYIGSSGVLVEKKDGAVTPVGSGYPLDLWFWAHDRGLSKDAGLRVTRIHDFANTLEFLLYVHDDGPTRTPNPNPRRAWLRERLVNLPCEWPPQSFHLEAIREVVERNWFEFEVIASANRAG